jgi:hypothetical protein
MQQCEWGQLNDAMDVDAKRNNDYNVIFVTMMARRVELINSLMIMDAVAM